MVWTYRRIENTPVEGCWRWSCLAGENEGKIKKESSECGQSKLGSSDPLW